MQQEQRTRTNLPYMEQDYLQLRLDTGKLHQDILNFLQGTTKVVDYDEELGKHIEKVVLTGNPLANEEGIQNLLNFVISTINSHTVQGNTEQEELYSILKYMHKHIALMLMANWREWGVDKNNRRHIVRTIMFMTRLVLSRTIGNEERKSYTPMVQKEATVVEREKKGGLL